MGNNEKVNSNKLFCTLKISKGLIEYVQEKNKIFFVPVLTDAGVPALYRISNGKITEFYFDSVEIEEFFNSIGRWDYGYKGNLKPYMVMDL